jgi:hypothetical protein
MLCRFEARHQARQEIFDRFAGDMAFLESVELHPGAIAAGYRTVADLVPRERLRTWAAECAETHKLIYSKVRVPSLPSGDLFFCAGRKRGKLNPFEGVHLVHESECALGTAECVKGPWHICEGVIQNCPSPRDVCVHF